MEKKGKRSLAGLFLAAALVAGGYCALTCPLPFHPWLWKKWDGLRGRMLDDLLEDHLVPDMTKDEVCALLGKYDYQRESHGDLLDTYYVRDHGVFYADFLTLYYVEQNGTYLYKTYQIETIDLF